MKKSITKLNGINSKIDKPIILTFLIFFISIFEFKAIDFFEINEYTKIETSSLENEILSKEFNLKRNDIKSIILLSFEGKKIDQTNELKWKIASDLNIDFFTIEKSIDGQMFETVGVIDCNENSNHLLDYELIDSDVKSEINYYRVKQTNFDGSFDYSEMISIDNSAGRLIKEINTIINLLGQEVNENYRGIVVIEYMDGTTLKVIQ